MQVHIGGLTVD